MTAITPYRTEIKQEWIDYNGHLSEAYYVLICGFATDQLMIDIGLDEEYRKSTGCSLYTVETHLRYLREIGLGAEVEVRPRVVGAAGKKLHIAYEMFHGDDLLFTEEVMCLHVDQKAGRAVDFPEEVLERLQPLIEESPAWLGRSISM